MRHKYNFDAEKLVFKKEQVSFRERIKIIGKYISGGLILGFIVWLISSFGLIESPERYFLEKKNANLLENIEIINSKFDNVNLYLSEIQNRDDNFYRVISQTNPLPASIRQAGFGGVDKYNNLKGYNNSSTLIDVMKKGDILLNQLAVQNKSFDTVMYLILNKEDSLLSIPAISPVAPNDYFRISSPFGLRVHPITGKILMHDGIDFAANQGKPIHASGNGIVSSVKRSSGGYGNRIIINHGYGFKTLYAHCSKIYVKEGDTVQRGSIIGLVGNTGTSTGPHLHYEVIQENKKKNPKFYYINDLSNKEYKEMIHTFASESK
jgi:murein DD-endopeptidase MepM/ murein hydrolase activator NlpD